MCHGVPRDRSVTWIVEEIAARLQTSEYPLQTTPALRNDVAFAIMWDASRQHNLTKRSNLLVRKCCFLNDGGLHPSVCLLFHKLH
mmetsp:Transcript_5883/g.8175  ORF Transcript_5883/g.8175 Transcript_5883/m.8175 type:complete len:85 (+) Transcript_5883:275-529(+)